MAEISILNKQNKELRHVFKEHPSQSSGHETPGNIFYDPSRLLNHCGLIGVVNKPPFEYVRTAGIVWEFYLLRFAKNISLRQYKKLVKRVPSSEDPIAGCSRRKLGNPYDKWHNNYPEINDSNLRKNTEPFANKLVSRKCPVRQKGSDDFIKKRRIASKALFEYLIGGKITQALFDKLRDCENFQDRLILLIKYRPQNDLFITSGLMTCLYGGRNVDWVDAKLAKVVSMAMKRRTSNSDIRNVCSVLDSQVSKKSFKPPYKDIYDPRRGNNRERVNINFRIQTWLKLMEDTFNARS